MTPSVPPRPHWGETARFLEVHAPPVIPYANVGGVQDDFQALGIGDEVRRDIATIELHPLDDFEGRLGGVAFFNRDDAIFPHLLLCCLVGLSERPFTWFAMRKRLSP